MAPAIGITAGALKSALRVSLQATATDPFILAPTGTGNLMVTDTQTPDSSVPAKGVRGKASAKPRIVVVTPAEDGSVSAGKP